MLTMGDEANKNSTSDPALCPLLSPAISVDQDDDLCSDDETQPFDPNDETSKVSSGQGSAACRSPLSARKHQYHALPASHSPNSSPSRRSSGSEQKSPNPLTEAAYRALERFLPASLLPSYTTTTTTTTHSNDSSPVSNAGASSNSSAKQDQKTTQPTGHATTTSHLLRRASNATESNHKAESAPTGSSTTTSSRRTSTAGVSDRQNIGPSPIPEFLPLNEITSQRSDHGSPAVRPKSSRGTISPAYRRRSNIITRSLIQQLAKKAQQRAESRLLSSLDVHITQQDGENLHDFKDMYLLRNEDIEDVVEVVAEEMRRRNSVSKMRNVSITDTNRPVLPRLSEDISGILPSIGTTADPATTIYMPRTSVATRNPLDLQIQTKVRDEDNHASATIVSRKSVAEIVWAQDDAPKRSTAEESHTPLTRKSSLKSMQNGLRRASSMSPPRVAFAGFSLNHYTTDDNLESLVADIGRAQTEPRFSTSEPELTSFPDLGSRHCTNEWLVPPIDLGTGPPLLASDFYHQGVDAHSGTEAWSPTPRMDEPMKPQICNYTLFDNDPFTDVENTKPASEPGVVEPSSARAEKRLGASIGISSRRRKSSQAIVRRDRSDSSEDHSIPTLADKIRKSGQSMFHSQHGSQEHSEFGAPTPYNSVRDPDSKPTSGIRSRDSIMRSYTPEQPMIDRVGIYEAMTGSRLLMRTKRGETCSEDNRPHACDDCVCGAAPE